MASIRKLNCDICQPRAPVCGLGSVSSSPGRRCAAGRPQPTTYSCHLEVSEDTTGAPAHDASVADLRRPRVVAHLRELQLGFGADSGRERRVADDVAEGLSAWENKGQQRISRVDWGEGGPSREGCGLLGIEPRGGQGLRTSQARTSQRPCASCGRGRRGCR